MDWVGIQNTSPGLYRVYWKNGGMDEAACGRDKKNDGGTWIAITTMTKALFEGDPDYFRIISQIEQLEWIDPDESPMSGKFYK